MFVTNWISTTKIQKISEITNFFRHYFLSRTEVGKELYDKFMSYGRMGVRLGNRTDGSIFRLEPDANNNVSATIRVNSFKPYLGFGYGGRLFRDNDIYHISFDAGILFWGGTPRITTNDIPQFGIRNSA